MGQPVRAITAVQAARAPSLSRLRLPGFALAFDYVSDFFFFVFCFLKKKKKKKRLLYINCLIYDSFCNDGNDYGG